MGRCPAPKPTTRCHTPICPCRSDCKVNAGYRFCLPSSHSFKIARRKTTYLRLPRCCVDRTSLIAAKSATKQSPSISGHIHSANLHFCIQLWAIVIGTAGSRPTFGPTNGRSKESPKTTFHSSALCNASPGLMGSPIPTFCVCQGFRSGRVQPAKDKQGVF